MLYEKEKTKNISFPLGGIGTGSIGLAGNGELIDWEIFNRPNKNTRNGYSHFAIKAVGKSPSAVRVLHGDTAENRMGSHRFGYGPRSDSMAGFPHFRNVRFDGTFPVAQLCFSDEDFPAVVRLNAFNPFIPHNEFDSSLPAAFFEWAIENTAGEEIEYALSFTVQNPAECARNEAVARPGETALRFICADKAENEIGYQELCIVTDQPDTVAEEYWYRGKWQDACTTFWRNFSESDRLPERHYDTPGHCDHGSLVAYVRIPAKQTKKIRFLLAWYVPNQYNYWDPCRDAHGHDVIWKNYYATQFQSAHDVAAYAFRKFSELYEKTKAFADALQRSSLPPFGIDAVSANLSVLKSPTVLRLEDGSLWGWEGCNEHTGSCEGSCQHVWNYAYALPFLFPRLERSLRENTMKYALFESGETAFRIPLPIGREIKRFRPCVDGQMGEVIKCYREWKISGDTEWLRSHADSIYKMLEFAWSEANPDRWDADRDGVMEGRQHNTLDMELFGPNAWLEGFYLLALDCGAKIAEALHDFDRAHAYRALYEQGKKWTNDRLFNGAYFDQKIDLKDRSVIDRFGAENYWNDEAHEIKYQIGSGCIIDQMLADWHAAIIGADGVFDDAKKQSALDCLYRFNYKRSMRGVANMWRIFSVNDESGTVICAYPDGTAKPAIPIPYCEETMTGFEYALAGLMIAQNRIAEGEAIVKAIRDRYDGEKRNPWNEIECGSNYARSMASYALMPIYSGFTFDMTEKYIGFSPVVPGDGQYVWSVGCTWGTVEWRGNRRILSVLGEPLPLSAFGLKKEETARAVRADGTEIPFRMQDHRIRFDERRICTRLEVDV